MCNKKGSSIADNDLLLLFLVVLVALGFLFGTVIRDTLQPVTTVKETVDKEALDKLCLEVALLRDENQELHRRMEKWLDAWEVMIQEVTAYAPTDPNAEEGLDYFGDP
jgi:predicted PurR-regulated permease PerM